MVLQGVQDRARSNGLVLKKFLPKDDVQERYDRLVELVNDIAWEENRRLAGSTVELLVADSSGKKDEATHRLTGRARDNRLVHFVPGHERVRPGDMVDVVLTGAAPHHLLSDVPPSSVRRTRAGDAWEARQGQTEVRTVGLGMPSIRPSTSAAASA